MLICFCMNYNRCLSLSHFLLLIVQYCESIFLLVSSYHIALLFCFMLLPVHQHPLPFSSIVPFCILHCPCCPFLSITTFSPPRLFLCLIPPSPWRPVLSLSNLHWLAEAAEPAGFAVLGAMSAAFEDGSCLRRSVSGCELCLSTGLRTHRWVPGWERPLQVLVALIHCPGNILL